MSDTPPVDTVLLYIDENGDNQEADVYGQQLNLTNFGLVYQPADTQYFIPWSRVRMIRTVPNAIYWNSVQ